MSAVSAPVDAGAAGLRVRLACAQCVHFRSLRLSAAGECHVRQIPGHFNGLKFCSMILSFMRLVLAPEFRNIRPCVKTDTAADCSVSV